MSAFGSKADNPYLRLMPANDPMNCARHSLLSTMVLPARRTRENACKALKSRGFLRRQDGAIPAIGRISLHFPKLSGRDGLAPDCEHSHLVAGFRLSPDACQVGGKKTSFAAQFGSEENLSACGIARLLCRQRATRVLLLPTGFAFSLNRLMLRHGPCNAVLRFSQFVILGSLG